MITLTGPQRKPASGKKPRQLVILLHGLGSDGNDLIELAPEFADILPDAQFLSPNAPFPCDMAPYGYQWFSLQDRSEGSILSGVREATPILNHYVDTALAEHQLTDKDVAFIGFSQGTMMALHVALRRPSPCAAVLGYSGALIAPSLLTTECQSKPSIMLFHGDYDTVVPISALDSALHALKSVDVPVKHHISKGLAHGIDQQGIKLGKKFLQEAFAPNQVAAK
jgi:phospholipase/carboxylesterase